MRGHSPSSHTGQPLLRTSRYGQTAEAGPRGHQGQPWCGGWEEEASGVTLRSAATTTTPPRTAQGLGGTLEEGRGQRVCLGRHRTSSPCSPAYSRCPPCPRGPPPRRCEVPGPSCPCWRVGQGEGLCGVRRRTGLRTRTPSCPAPRVGPCVQGVPATARSVFTTKVWGSVRGYELGSHGRSTVMGRRRGGLPPPLCHWRRGIVHTATATESGLGPASLSPGIPEPVSS